MPPGIELLKFLVSKVLINNTNFYLVKIKTIELAIFLISIFIAVIFLTVQRYGKGSIPPNSMEINFPKTSVFTLFLMIFPLLLVTWYSLDPALFVYQDTVFLFTDHDVYISLSAKNEYGSWGIKVGYPVQKQIICKICIIKETSCYISIRQIVVNVVPLEKKIIFDNIINLKEYHEDIF